MAFDGNYHDKADIINRFADESVVAPMTGSETTSVDDNTLTELASGAEGVIDSYAGSRYSVPLDVATNSVLAALLKSAALDLTVYALYKNRGKVPQDVKDARDATVAWLRDVASGKVTLATDDTESASNAVAPPVRFDVGPPDGSKRLFTRDSMKAL